MIYEYRAYYVMPGRMPDIQKRFADVTMKLFPTKERDRSAEIAQARMAGAPPR